MGFPPANRPGQYIIYGFVNPSKFSCVACAALHVASLSKSMSVARTDSLSKSMSVVRTASLSKSM